MDEILRQVKAVMRSMWRHRHLAMIVTWILGLWLAWDAGFFKAPWLHGKLALVIALSVIHVLFARWVKDFAADRNTRSQKIYRIVNEIPTVLMIGIVILVIVKPF